MAFDYSGLVTVAADLLDSFGREVTLKVASKTPVDSDKSWGARQTDAVATDDQTITGVKAVFVIPTSGRAGLSDAGAEQQRAGTTTNKRRLKVFIAPSELGGTVIDDSWQLVDGTTTYEILVVNPVRPGPDLILYEIELEV